MADSGAARLSGKFNRWSDAAAEARRQMTRQRPRPRPPDSFRCTSWTDAGAGCARGAARSGNTATTGETTRRWCLLAPRRGPTLGRGRAPSRKHESRKPCVVRHPRGVVVGADAREQNLGVSRATHCARKLAWHTQGDAILQRTTHLFVVVDARPPGLTRRKIGRRITPRGCLALASQLTRRGQHRGCGVVPLRAWSTQEVKHEPEA